MECGGKQRTVSDFFSMCVFDHHFGLKELSDHLLRYRSDNQAKPVDVTQGVVSVKGVRAF